MTYLVEVMRSLMLDGWEAATIAQGFAAAGVVAAITMPLAVDAFRATVRE